MRSRYPLVLPVLGRYVTGQFLYTFGLVMASFVLLYVVIDLFDRLDILLRHDATFSASARYFLFKVPLMITQITPPAVITSILISLGMTSRNNEIAAMRASGISLIQMSFPLALVSLAISVAALAWNETVVPYCSREFQYVNNVEIRKRDLRAMLSDREIWYHGADGFYNVDYVDRQQRRIHGLVIYRFDPAFQLKSVTEVPEAEWSPRGWRTTSGAVQHRLEAGQFSTIPLASEILPIPETPEDFLEVQREPEELSYAVLRRRINDLTRKGIDVSRDRVDLYMKLAVPFASAVLGLLAIPIAGRLRRQPSIAWILALGIAVGFSYWVVLGLANSLGQSGAVPALVAAWAANVIYVLVAAALFLSSD